MLREHVVTITRPQPAAIAIILPPPAAITVAWPPVRVTGDRPPPAPRVVRLAAPPQGPRAPDLPPRPPAAHPLPSGAAAR